jgi:hypothetical protein
MRFVSFILVCFFGRAYGSDNGSPNLSVSMTYISSCMLNTDTANAVCMIRGSVGITQYHDVRSMVGCEYHYCMTFREDRLKLVCGGFVWTNAAGTSSTSPLSPAGTHVRNDSMSVTVDEQFDGYNVGVSYLERGVTTWFGRAIESVTCEGPHGTCVYLQDATKICFGYGSDDKFYGDLISFELGAGVNLALTVPIYLVARFCFARAFRYNVFRFGFLPLVCFLVTLSVMFFSTGLIVKVYPFLIGSVFCVLVVSSALTVLMEFIYAHFGTRTAVATEEEQSVPLNTGDKPRDEDEEDEEEFSENVTTIELS